MINNKTVKETEKTLTLLNSKTCNYEKFKKYSIEKNKIKNYIVIMNRKYLEN